MSAPYEDAPLMILTGLIGVYFGVLGVRAFAADRRERKAVPPAREEDGEAWETAVAVRRLRQ